MKFASGTTRVSCGRTRFKLVRPTHHLLKFHMGMVARALVFVEASEVGFSYGAQPFVRKQLEKTIKFPQWTGNISNVSPKCQAL